MESRRNRGDSIIDLRGSDVDADHDEPSAHRSITQTPLAALFVVIGVDQHGVRADGWVGLGNSGLCRRGH